MTGPQLWLGRHHKAVWALVAVALVLVAVVVIRAATRDEPTLHHPVVYVDEEGQVLPRH